MWGIEVSPGELMLFLFVCALAAYCVATTKVITIITGLFRGGECARCGSCDCPGTGNPHTCLYSKHIKRKRRF